MKKIYLLLCLQLILLLVHAQDSTDHCGTADMDTTEFKQLPWFDNNQLLEDFLDSIGYPNGSSRIIDQGIRYWIPVKFWIYRDDNGNGGPTLREIRDMMDNLNRLYNQVNNTQIGFYLKCEPTYINNSEHLIKTLAGAALIIGGTNRDYGCVNVHVVDQIRQNVAGMAIQPTNGLIINRTTYTGNTSALAHEMGHIFGLVHTHLHYKLRIKCFTESISRTRDWALFNLCFQQRNKKVCESTGDALRDTNADPILDDNYSCDYNKGKHDPWGDSYEFPANGLQEKPDPSNIMSYNAAEICIERFSRLQIAVMLRTIKWEKALIDQEHWKDNRYTFDSFEPDNNSEMSRFIGLNETQERNFHQQYNRDAAGFYPNTTQCDVDWVRFVAPCNSNLDITTSAMAGRTNANTRLTLFNSTLTQLAQNDDISGTNLFSKLSFNFTAGQEYFIRIDNMSSGTTGYYALNVSTVLAVNGPEIINCNTIYSVTPVTGASYSWTTSTNLTIIGSTTSSSVTVSPNTFGGTGWVEITVTSPCGLFTVRKNVSLINFNDAFISAEGNVIFVNHPSDWNVLAYRWYKDGVFFRQTTVPQISTSQAFECHEWSVDFQTACGWSGETLPESIGCGFSMSSNEYVVYPNPVTSGGFNVKLKNDGVQRTIILQDKNFRVWRSVKTKEELVYINVSDLPGGTYYLSIRTEKKKETHQVIIENNK